MYQGFRSFQLDGFIIENSTVEDENKKLFIMIRWQQDHKRIQY